MGMRGLMLGAGSALIMSASAFGADIATKSPYSSANVNWSGLYLGGHAGFGYGRATITDPTTPDSGLSTTVKGFLGGGQLGYNLQSGALVYGIDADFSGSDIDGSTTEVDPGGNLALSNPRVRWTSLATGRLGYAMDRTLFYVKGGAAFAGFRYTAIDFTAGTRGSTNFNRTGWTVGGGLDYALTGPWSLRAQYDYVHFGTKSFTLTDSTGASGPVGLRQQLHQFKAGLNYRFGGM